MPKPKHFPFVRLRGDILTVIALLTPVIEKNAVPDEERNFHNWIGGLRCHGLDTIDVGVVNYAKGRWKLVDNEPHGGTDVCYWYM